MKGFSYFSNTILIIQTELRDAPRSHSFTDLWNRENDINLGNRLDILVPNKLMLTELQNYIVHEWLIAMSDFLLMDHQLLTKLMSFRCCVTLKVCSLAWENQLFRFFFTGFQADFRNLNLISRSNTHKRNLCVIKVFSPLFKLMLKLFFYLHFGRFLLIIVSIMPRSRL